MARARYYAEYLRLDRILDAQYPAADEEGVQAHDEMLFIIVHQAYELWFKQIIFELDSVQTLMAQANVPARDLVVAESRLRRIHEIQKLMLSQLDVLETMKAIDFLDFRDLIVPASGFQSFQFREIEARLGLRAEDRPGFGRDNYTRRLEPEHRERVHAAESTPALFDLVNDWLGRTPYLEHGDFAFWAEYQVAVTDMLGEERTVIERNPGLGDAERAAELKRHDALAAHFAGMFEAETYAGLERKGPRRLSHRAFQAALLINLYRDEPVFQIPFRVLSVLMDIEEALTLWRYRHALMAERMIGGRIGTGGSSGPDYLREGAARGRVFADLFFIATCMIGRSRLPALPPELVERLRQAD